MGPQARRPEGISLPEKHCFFFFLKKISNCRSNLVRSVRDNEKNRQKHRLCNKASSQSQDVVSLSTYSRTLHLLIPPPLPRSDSLFIHNHAHMVRIFGKLFLPTIPPQMYRLLVPGCLAWRDSWKPASGLPFTFCVIYSQPLFPSSHTGLLSTP